MRVLLYVSLHKNKITDEGCIYIADALKENLSLRTLQYVALCVVVIDKKYFNMESFDVILCL